MDSGVDTIFRNRSTMYLLIFKSRKMKITTPKKIPINPIFVAVDEPAGQTLRKSHGNGSTVPKGQ